MAHIKHAHLRYNILDRCFRRTHRPYTFQELLEEVNTTIQEFYPDASIGIRTLREDIKMFRNPEGGFGAPLLTEKHHGKNVYRYEDPNFSIAQRPLLRDEQYLLETAQQLLDRFENDPQYDKLSEALVLFQDEAEIRADTGYGQLLFYDKNEAYEGLGFLKPIFLAIKNKTVLKVNYKGFHDTEAMEFIFHPYVLKQYNQRWFVFGYNESSDIEKWSIPLDDRLKNFEELPDKSLKEDRTDWKEFFINMIGVRNRNWTNEKTLQETVVLRFNPKRIDYFKTKPIHPFWDEFLEEGKENQVFFETVINLELIQQILSYGRDVEVVAPESLRLHMKQQIEELYRMYED